ncbi:MAG TPA: response regulator transcription factor [Clostridiales bacterium]|nr:response regulator transcription factor [Clostridiales bacterium]
MINRFFGKGLRKYYPSKLVENTLNGARRDGLQLLTERELDVLSELRKGLTNGEISNKLFITEGTTKKHISSILNKLKLSNRVEAVIYSMSIIIIVNEQIIKSK